LKEWLITIVEILGIVVAFLGTIIVLIMMSVVVQRIQKKQRKLKVNNKGRIKMIKDKQRESITFNDVFMFMIAVPLVLLWVGFAGYVIWTGLAEPGVLDQIESYTTLIAILGGPALLIIKDALDVWKTEQASKTEFYKTKAQAIIDYNASVLQQAQNIESNEQAQDHKERHNKK
tara:strand:- start:1404 stop:1925 length:522 start_codon:yes stop_codon:yes gene_type:complete